MLVIMHRNGESFFIGDEIKIVILDDPSQVRVGIDAPRDVELVGID